MGSSWFWVRPIRCNRWDDNFVAWQTSVKTQEDFPALQLCTAAAAGPVWTVDSPAAKGPLPWSLPSLELHRCI